MLYLHVRLFCLLVCLLLGQFLVGFSLLVSCWLVLISLQAGWFVLLVGHAVGSLDYQMVDCSTALLVGWITWFGGSFRYVRIWWGGVAWGLSLIHI